MLYFPLKWVLFDFLNDFGGLYLNRILWGSPELNLLPNDLLVYGITMSRDLVIVQSRLILAQGFLMSQETISRTVNYFIQKAMSEERMFIKAVKIWEYKFEGSLKLGLTCT